MFRILLVFVLSAMAGCSTQGVYNDIQESNRQACQKVPPPQYDECIERSSKPYRDYERERDAVINESK